MEPNDHLPGALNAAATLNSAIESKLPTFTELNAAVMVCAERDIECGPNHRAWCESCPKLKTRKEIFESLGPYGPVADALTGAPIRMDPTLGPNEVVIVPPLGPVTITLPDPPVRKYFIQGRPVSEMALKADAFDKIAKLMQIDNYDGVLARIREIIGETK